jgi:probable phosphoglycerate mutase
MSGVFGEQFPGRSTVNVIVWLVRHGETDWNAAGRFQGWTDVPLNETGRKQADRLRESLGSHDFDGVWSSDLARAVETARIAVGEPTTDSRLREMDFGDIEGAIWNELDETLRAGLKEFDSFRSPGGESAAEFVERVFGFLDGLTPGRHVVFAHGGVIRAIGRVCGSDAFPSHTDIVKLDWTNRSSLESDASPS